MKIFLLIVLVAICQPALCQQDAAYFESSREAQGTPFWTAKSNPVNGNTVIMFFDEEGNLLYREQLRGQLIKPSRRNIRKFDRMLHLMVENKLVAGRADTTPFPSASGNYTLTSQRTYTDYQSVDPVSIKTRAYTLSTGKLSLYLYNPRKSQILISLVDTDGRTIHEEKTSILNYGRDFDISHLKVGTYNLSIVAGRIDETYKLEVGPSRLYSMNKLEAY